MTTTAQLKLVRPVVMVGMMGAGKSAIGLALSRALGVAFKDSDQEIERAAAMTIAEIFARDGEAFFRAREAEVIERLLGEGAAILSTGGGAYLQASNRAAISAHGCAVWLKADLDLLWSRVRGKDTRPLLMTENPKATLAELLHARTPFYAQADVIVETQPSWSIPQTTQAVIEALTQAHVLQGE